MLNLRCFVGFIGAVGLLGCSDPVPPAAQGGLTLTVFQGSGQLCDAGRPFTYIAAAPGDCGQEFCGPTTTDPGARLIHGDPGVNMIACTVSGDGTTFSAAGEIRVSDAWNRSTGQGSSVAFTLSGGTIVAGSTGTATIGVGTPDVNQLQSTSPCQLSVNTGNLQVAEGRLWASFTCPEMKPTGGALGQTTCSASGQFVLENCD